MRLYNESRYPDDEVRSLVEFAAGEIDTRGVAVKVKNRKDGYSGCCYHGVPSISPLYKLKSVRRLITIRLGAPDTFGVLDWHSQEYKTIDDLGVLGDWQEALVYVAAHEFQHHYQIENGRKLSEVDAIRYGAQRLAAWRREQDRAESIAEYGLAAHEMTNEIGEWMLSRKKEDAA